MWGFHSFRAFGFLIFAFKLKFVKVEIRDDLTASDNDPYQQWLDDLKDMKGRNWSRGDELTG